MYGHGAKSAARWSLLLMLLTPGAQAAEPVLVKPFIRRSSISLDHHTNGGSLNYSPNIGTSTGASLSWGGLSFELSEQLKPAKEDIQKSGETKSTTYGFSWLNDRWSLEAFHLQFDGFYLTNPEAVGLSLAEEDPFPQYPDMSLQSSGANIFVVFFPESFSLPALYQQTKRQTSSGISPILEVGASATTLKSFNSVTSTVVEEAHFLGGLGFTMAFGSPFFSVSVMAGRNYQNVVETTETEVKDSTDSTVHANLKSGLGWNGEKGVGGISLNMERLPFKLAGDDVYFMRSVLEAYLGYRF